MTGKTKKSKKNSMTKIEEYALGLSLCDVDSYDSYEEALEAVRRGEAIIWEPFENHETDWVVENIETNKETLTWLMDDLLKEVLAVSPVKK
jgi:hypothetical protein